MTLLEKLKCSNGFKRGEMAVMINLALVVLPRLQPTKNVILFMPRIRLDVYSPTYYCRLNIYKTLQPGRDTLRGVPLKWLIPVFDDSTFIYKVRAQHGIISIVERNISCSIMNGCRGRQTRPSPENI